MWQNIFDQSYESTPADQLSQFIEAYIERISVLKTNKDIHVILKMILNHSRLLTVDRDNLLAFLNKYDVRLPVNSFQIVDIALESIK